MAPILTGLPDVWAWTLSADSPTSAVAPANLAMNDEIAIFSSSHSLNFFVAVGG
jgi:hypothetical protein